MYTEYIREFVVLAECMSYSEAAERLYISQSALSKHIQSLERSLDTVLFNRTTRSISLSDAGNLYLPYAREITALCQKADASLTELLRRKRQPLIIAVMENPQYYDLAKYMLSFKQAHPSLNFSMVEGDEFGLYDMFKKKTVNIFPTFSNFKAPIEYTFMPMVNSSIVALVRRDHPFAEAKHVTLDELSRERLLLPTRGGSLSNLIHDAFRESGLVPDIVYEGSSIGCIDLVKAGMGISLHSKEFAATAARDSDMVSVTFEPGIPFTYGLGHRPVEEMSNDEELYLNHMRNYAI